MLRLLLIKDDKVKFSSNIGRFKVISEQPQLHTLHHVFIFMGLVRIFSCNFSLGFHDKFIYCHIYPKELQ